MYRRDFNFRVVEEEGRGRGRGEGSLGPSLIKFVEKCRPHLTPRNFAAAMAGPDQEDWQAAQAEEGRPQPGRPHLVLLRQVLRRRSLQAHRGDHQV